MGQQQLLIIVLSSMLIGLATYGGLRMYGMYNQGSNRDQLVVNTYSLVGMAEAYAKRPASQGGGGGSFLGLKLSSGLFATSSGKITYTVARATLTFTGTGVVTGKNGKSNVQVYCVYAKGSMKVSELN